MIMSSNAVTGALVTLPNRNVLTIGLLRHLVALERWVLDPSRLGLSSAWTERFTYQGVRPHRGPEPRLAQGTARGATESGPSSSSRNGRAPWDWWQRWYRVNPDPPWRLPLAAALASLVASVSVSSAEEVWDLGRAADAAQKALVAAEEEIRRQGGGSFPAGGAAAEQLPEVIPDTKSGQLRIRIPLPPDVVPRLLLHRLEQAFHRVPGCHGFVAQTTSDLHGSTTLLHTGSAVRFGSPAGSVAVKLYVPYRAAADPERQPMLEVVLGPSFSKQHWQFLTQVAVSAAASCSDGGWAEAGPRDMFGSPGSQMELLNELRKELMGHFGGFDSLFGAMPGFPPPQGGMDFAPPPDDMRPFSPPDQAGAGGGQKGIVQQLEKMGTQVVLPQANSQCDWGVLAGYEEQKQEIEQTILLALKQPELFDSVARGTRVHYKPNRPRAVLFEGPPGTGKTTSAKVIANQAAVPLIYLPLNSLMSKYYDQLQGAIVFIDEIDSLALSRSGEMWEATRRLLAVLLAFIDGFDSKQRTLVIGATNRKSDLDAAMLSRFDVVIGFPIPDAACRHAILKQYAKHLKPEELQLLVDATDGCSGRDLRNLCEYAERRHTAAIYHSRAPASSLPSCKDYLAAAKRSGSGSRMAEGARDTDGSGRSERAALLSKLLPEMVR